MAGTDIMTHSPVILRPDPSRTVIRPFLPEDPKAFAVEGQPRARRIVKRALSLEGEELAEELERITAALDERHRDVDEVLLRRFDEVRPMVGDLPVEREHRRLIGAYFSQEYSFEGAALFNPSMVLHPDQDGAPAGGIRFILSLRAIGEGHVSSVTFRTGSWSPADGFVVDDPSPAAVAPRIEQRGDQGVDRPEDGATAAPTKLHCGGSRDLSETVLFPVTPAQRQGIEDVRLVRFTEDDGTVQYFGTYTAFSGAVARSELLHVDAFHTFDMRPLTGSAADSKGLALFPRKIGGQYVMLGRQDSENIWLIRSDDLHHWEGGERIIGPERAWEVVQMGNCGSPIEIDEGWLVLTHGVGTVRNYCLGACLLDKDDPTRVIGRMALPLVHPSPKERDGYVPNVVYSCGALVHERTLLLPYGVADSFATFASVALDDLLVAMRPD